jgi:hypothetical protein
MVSTETTIEDPNMANAPRESATTGAKRCGVNARYVRPATRIPVERTPILTGVK